MKKRILGILLALVMVLTLLPASAGAANVLYSGTCGDNATWVFTDDGVMTISGTGTVTKPMSAEETSTKLKNVHTLIIEEGITAIDNNAFSSYGVEQYDFQTICLPDSLKTIGTSAFRYEESLTELRFGSGLETIGETAFAGCTALCDLVLPDGLKKLDHGAFQECTALEEIVVPGSVKVIERTAFSYCTGLKSAIFMDGVQQIGPGLFYGCTSLEEVYLPDTIQLRLEGTFAECSSLKTVRIPAQISEIGSLTFLNCTSLEYIIMSGSITDIYGAAFAGTSNLKEIYYAGTEAQLSGIRVDQEGNEKLESVDIHFIPAMPDPVFYLYDMPARDNWAYPGIAFCLYSGLMKGVGDGYFQPNSYTTRAQLVAILWRLMGEPKPESPAPFTDLTQDWYRDAVAWAAENNITKGTSATTFAPDEYVTREQMVTIFYRMCRDYLGFDMSPSASLDKFPDNGKVSGWAVDAMKWGIAVKLINGAADGSGNVYLMPQGNAIRSQVATVMLNFVTAFEEYFVDEDTTDAAPQTPAALPTEGLASRKGI